MCRRHRRRLITNPLQERWPTMPFAVTGKILRVDLSARTHRIEEPDETLYRTYVGGSALACRYLSG